MKITEKQLQLLYIILSDSIRNNIINIFTLTYETRADLWKQIVEQQSDEIIDIKDKICH